MLNSYNPVPTANKPTVSINGIWFSLDGSIPESIHNNLKELRKKINASSFKDQYEICLWTDITKLKDEERKRLSELGVIIKDYRNDIHVQAQDSPSQKLNYSVSEF